ncbi:MAG: mechanosensitive ion channel [Clostridia bacterium]|nr:mechanosensitive ion channel [Clostridia bacterium]
MGNYSMDIAVASIYTFLASAGGKILFALIVFIIGKLLIKMVLNMLSKNKFFNKADGAVKTFTLSFVKIGLYVILVISIIGILGVPMASIVAVLASAGVAVGLALQGALSNLAGGIMLMIFRPFRLGDYVEAAGVSGVVKEVTMFYTVFLTLDNRRITVPNGSLMNANIVDYSSEELRRVDLTFSCAKSESPAAVQDMLMQVIKANPSVLSSPEPFARLSGGTNEAMEFTVRAWCKNADYWDVYFDLTQKVTEAFAANGIKAPAVRIVSEN